MTLTPSFLLSQTPSHVTVVIRVPHVRVIGCTECHLCRGGDGDGDGDDEFVDEHFVGVEECSSGAGDELYFYCRPYYLHLRFPGLLVDDESRCGDGTTTSSESSRAKREMVLSYDPDDHDGTVTLTIPKLVENQHFADLDLVTKLMQPRRLHANAKENGGNASASASASVDMPPGRKIVEVSSSSVADGFYDEDEVPPLPFSPEPTVSLSDDLNRLPRYGFARRFYGVFHRLLGGGETLDWLHLPDPDVTPDDHRTSLRLFREEQDFDSERYLADNYFSFAASVSSINGHADDDPYVDMLRRSMEMVPFWLVTPKRQDENRKESMPTITDLERSLEKTHLDNDDDVNIMLSREEIDQLAHIPNIDIPPDLLVKMSSKQSSPQNQKLLFVEEVISRSHDDSNRYPSDAQKTHLWMILELLYAFAYDHRTTDGEPTCESAWTISVLSSTLSWFETYGYLLLLPSSSEKKINDNEEKDDVVLIGSENIEGLSCLRIVDDKNEDNNNSKDDIVHPNHATETYQRQLALLKESNKTMGVNDNDVGPGVGQISVVLLNLVRRTMIYPLLRNHGLALHIIRNDLPAILRGGRRAVLRVLLRIRSIFSAQHQYYWHNRLYVDGLCVWMQRLDDETWRDLSKDVETTCLLDTPNNGGAKWSHKEHLQLGDLVALESLWYDDDDDDIDGGSSDETDCSDDDDIDGESSDETDCSTNDDDNDDDDDDESDNDSDEGNNK